MTRLVALSRRQAAHRRRAPSRRSASARDLRAKAAAARGSVDQARLAAVAAAAHEANALIDRRMFSWTELFNRFEATLPPGVRIAAVRPSVDQQGRLIMTIAVVARSVDDVDAFIEALEATARSATCCRARSGQRRGPARGDAAGRVPAGRAAAAASPAAAESGQ